MVTRPLICLDVDGVVNLRSLPGEPSSADAVFELLDGVPHALAPGARENIQTLCEIGEVAWATGWGPRANRLLSPALGLPELAEIPFEKYGTPENAYWKVDGIARHAGSRPITWLDDAFDERCRSWAETRQQTGQPTLLVGIDGTAGLTAAEVTRIAAWARKLGFETGPADG